MIELRKEVAEKLTPVTIDRIRKALKPTKTAEAMAVVKELKGVSLSLDEIAEIINISEPGRGVKAKASDYSSEELGKNPELIITRTPKNCFVRYVFEKKL